MPTSRARSQIKYHPYNPLDKGSGDILTAYYYIKGQMSINQAVIYVNE